MTGAPGLVWGSREGFLEEGASELRFVEEDELGRGRKVWRDGMEGRGRRKRGKNTAQNKQILGSLGVSEWSPVWLEPRE